MDAAETMRLALAAGVELEAMRKEVERQRFIGETHSVALAERKTSHEELGRRHADLAGESRNRVGLLEQRAAALGQWEHAVATMGGTIEGAVGRIRALETEMRTLERAAAEARGEARAIATSRGEIAALEGRLRAVLSRPDAPTPAE